MRSSVADVAAILALALIVTAAIAAPVLRAPSDRVFGMEIVGRHHDPFTVMAQFGRPIALGVYSQPITDVSGMLLARAAGVVASYNWLVLLSFPLAAVAAYLLARHLALSQAGATVAALAYAFSPFHLAHAAYHPHIAQTQWIPLYLLALWRCLDDATPGAVGFLVAATVGVTLSNFYGGLIAAVVTPIAIGAYWFVRTRPATGSARHLAVTMGTLALLAGAGLAYVWWTARIVVLAPAAFAFDRSDLFLYSAKWWGYLVPPVEHPWIGAAARRVWTSVGVGKGLLEQQVSLGWGIVALGLVAILGRDGQDRRDGLDGLDGERPWQRRAAQASLARVPVLVAVAVTALLCSLSPERTIGGWTFVRPSALLYDIVPMFRSYARFGVVVQLMAALLAGVGVDRLRRGTRGSRIACIALVAFAVCEYAVSPSAMSRDVLPTAAHRWVMQQGDNVRALDCTPLNQESESIQWLTGHRVTLLSGSIDDCLEPNLSDKLAASGYTHLLVRRDTADGRWFGDRPAPAGLRVAADFGDGEVFAVTAPIPAVYTAAMTGFFEREHDAEWTWRWMGAGAAWTIVNASGRPVGATLGIEMTALHDTRHVDLLLDGRHMQTLIVEPSRRTYEIVCSP